MRDRHHIWWPRRDYQTALEKRFRTLACNIVTIDRDIHRLIHVYQEPPLKPSIADMHQAVARHKSQDCGCYRG